MLTLAWQALDSSVDDPGDERQDEPEEEPTSTGFQLPTEWDDVEHSEALSPEETF